VRGGEDAVIDTSARARLRAAEVAAGTEPADLVLIGGRVVDVHTGRVFSGDVAVGGPLIVAVGNVEHCIGGNTQVVDCSGLYIVPGFIDTHIHIGGSQLTVEGLAEVMVPHGTAGLCTDFYEPAIIGGLTAALQLLERAEGTGLEIFLSAFHASALGMGMFGNLNRFTVEDLHTLMQHPACAEIREWSDAAVQIPIPGLREVYEGAVDRRVVVGGHLEGLRGREVQASAALGVMSDHETVGAEEAFEKVRAGIQLQIREGSGARDLGPVVKAITELGADPESFSLCTDEQELDSLVIDGHLDHKLRMVVANGVPPIQAVRMATLNAARYLNRERDYGAVAPGRVASLVALEDLASFQVRLTVSGGQLSSQDGRYLLAHDRRPYPDEWRRTVAVAAPVTAERFLFDPGNGPHRMRVIGVTAGSLITQERIEEVTLTGGRLASPGAALAKIAVIDRHEGGERMGLGLIRGLGIQRGAVAATFNPGAMNLMVMGTTEEDMAVAASRVVEMDGGVAVAEGGQIRADLALPVFGIFSDAPVAEAVDRYTAVTRAMREDLGSSTSGLLTTAGFACLAVVIPSLKICDRGLARVTRTSQEAVSLFVDQD
jgi:adenine deaminase